jgi:hypothetical protein
VVYHIHHYRGTMALYVFLYGVEAAFLKHVLR